MSIWEILIYALAGYCVLDFITSIIAMRCVLPLLKCPECRAHQSHGCTKRG